LLGQSASKAGIQIITDALADINAKVSGTTNVSSFSNGSLTTAQTASIQAAASQAVMDSIAEIVTGKTSFDGFRLAESNPVSITDHEGAIDVKHTPDFSVSGGVLTLDSSNIQVNKSSMQDALDLKAGAKGLKIEVELGTLPTTSDTIEFTGKLIDGTDATISDGERSIEVRFQVKVDPTKEVGAYDYLYVPGGNNITVIYTGEDGTATTTTVNHSGNMVIVDSSAGAPKLVVDFNEVFARGIPETNLSSYFTTSTVSDGNYYTELTFSGASMQTSNGEVFEKVIAPFKVASTTKPVIYFEDITVSEAEGWNQITLNLSKPATETFTLKYNLGGGTATADEDFWWWTDETGYRSVTFVEGQSSAVINVDVRNDNSTEGDETIVYNLSLASGSEGKVILSKTTATVTISDDESSTGISYESLVEKVMAKLKASLEAELKVLTDANSADLSSTSTTFTNILLSNTDISDISAYLTTEVSDDIALYDPILTSVMSLIDTYVMAIRGPSGIREGLKIDGSDLANDLAALNIGFDMIDLSEFTSTSASDLNTALINDVYTDSGFKYTGTTSVNNNSLVYSRTIDTDAEAYADLLFPSGDGLRSTNFNFSDNFTITYGTSGNDTATLSTGNTDVLYIAGDGNDTITMTDNNSDYAIFGGAGNDIIANTQSSSARKHLFDGGAGNDTLFASAHHNVVYKGGVGNDVFVLNYNTSWKWDSGNSFGGNDNNQDGITNYDEYYNIQGVVADFENGSDKIGLKGSDWSGKTIVVQQGTGTMSSHTFLLTGSAERGGDSDYQYWLILWNTTASDITSDDFVLVDANYATSSLSGVTISASISDAGLETEDGRLDGSGSEDAFLVTGILDSSSGFQFDNLNNPDPVFEINQLDNLVFNNYQIIAENTSDYSIITELEEEEILISIDIV
jgi:hypothetical protein